MLPAYEQLRETRARPPNPVAYNGRSHDIMGMNDDGKLLLRDDRAIHLDVRVESFTDRPVMLDGLRWQVVSLEALTGPSDAILQLADPQDASRLLMLTGDDTTRVQFLGTDCEYTLGPVKHGIVRMSPSVPCGITEMSLQPGQQFEVRLRDRELEGPYLVEVGHSGLLVAEGLDQDGNLQHLTIGPDDIAPRYETVDSIDFGTSFDVDAFLFREDQLRGRATSIGADPDGGPVQDPLLGLLSPGAIPLLTSGIEHLAVFEQFIRDHTPPETTVCSNGPRRLSLLNISITNQGDARGVLDALVGFRQQNPEADMSIVVSKLGPAAYQNSPEYVEYVDTLDQSNIRVDTCTGADGPTRQVMHAKGIVIDEHVMFSTGAVMDTWPINKADFSIELPPLEASVFQRYTDEAVHGDATPERRNELAANLASHGVLINDPVAGLTYISRAQDALIRGASRQLTVSMSELVDPAVTQTLIDRAAGGVQVLIQIRQLDPVSAQLLADAVPRLRGSLRLENMSWWEPRPHFNAILADGCVAYLGTSYLWPTQRSMVHQGRSFENGVLLGGDAVASVAAQIEELRTHAYTNRAVNLDVSSGCPACATPPLTKHYVHQTNILERFICDYF